MAAGCAIQAKRRRMITPSRPYGHTQTSPPMRPDKAQRAVLTVIVYNRPRKAQNSPRGAFYNG